MRSRMRQRYISPKYLACTTRYHPPACSCARTHEHAQTSTHRRARGSAATAVRHLRPAAAAAAAAALRRTPALTLPPLQIETISLMASSSNSRALVDVHDLRLQLQVKVGFSVRLSGICGPFKWDLRSCSWQWQCRRQWPWQKVWWTLCSVSLARSLCNGSWSVPRRCTVQHVATQYNAVQQQYNAVQHGLVQQTPVRSTALPPSQPSV